MATFQRLPISFNDNEILLKNNKNRIVLQLFDRFSIKTF